MARLLTETAAYDELGSWGKMSDGWPGIKSQDNEPYDMYVFANMTSCIPYGSYVLMSQQGRYGATISYLRVHADYIEKLKAAFKKAGKPIAEESIKNAKA